MMDGVTSFTVTLQSNLEKQSFPMNKNFEFSNSLHRPINLEGFEVALVNAFFTDKYEKPNYKPITVTKGENVNFFNEILSDNRIVVTSSSTSTLVVTKTEDNYVNFLTTVKTSLALQGMHCDIIVTFEAGKVVKLEVKFHPPTGYYLSLPFPVNRLLGIDLTEIHPGNYAKDIDESYYESYFKTIKDGFLGNITLFCYDNVEIELSQLKGHQTANTVLNHILEALDTHDVDASMILHADTLSIEYEIIPDTTRVVLSDFLYDFFGISKEFSFKGNGNVPISSKNLFNDNTDDYLFEDDVIRSSSKVLVICSIIQPQLYGGKPVQMLQLLDRFQRSGVESAYYPNILIYKDVNVQYTSHITISLKNDQNEYISYSKYPSVITLHLRRKFPRIF